MNQTLLRLYVSVFVAIIGLSVATSANAAVKQLRLYEIYQCPAMHPEYTRLLDQIRGLKHKIEEAARCGSLRNQVDSLADYVGQNRSDFVAKVTKKRNEMLSVEDSRKLQGYANEASKRALTLIDLLNGDDGCVGEETKGQLLSRSSSIVYEASNLLASVAGPYGVPIAIGGSILSGVLKGVAHFYESQSGFQFDKFEQRQFYAESVCQFYRFQQEADILLDPEAAIYGLKRLEVHMMDQVDTLRINCPECADLIAYFVDPYNQENELKFQNTVDELRLQANAAYKHPLGNETIQALRTLVWLEEESGRYNSIVAQERIGQGPRELMHESLDMSKFLFTKWAPDFVDWYASSARREFRKFKAYLNEWARDLWNPQVRSWNNKRDGPFPEMPSRSDFVGTLEFIRKSESYARSPQNFRTKMSKQGKLLKMSSLSLRVAEDYCGFFQEIKEYEDDLMVSCESTRLLRLQEDLAKLDPYWQRVLTAREAGATRNEALAPNMGGRSGSGSMSTGRGSSGEESAGVPVAAPQPAMRIEQRKANGTWVDGVDILVERGSSISDSKFQRAGNRRALPKD